MRNLFGVPIPEGAVRVVIRPVLGPGRSLAILKVSLEDGAAPDDDDVIFAASRNTEFWDYWDSRKSGKRNAEPDATEWKLRLTFYDSKEGEEAFTTETAFAFFRSGKPRSADGDDRYMRLFKHLKRSTDKAIAKMAGSLAEMTTASTAAIGAVGTASANALAEASKQTSVVSEMTKLAFDESIELKESLLALHAKNAEPTKPAGGVVQQAKELFDMGKTIMSMTDGWSGAAKVEPPPPSGDK